MIICGNPLCPQCGHLGREPLPEPSRHGQYYGDRCLPRSASRATRQPQRYGPQRIRETGKPKDLCASIREARYQAQRMARWYGRGVFSLLDEKERLCGDATDPVI